MAKAKKVDPFKTRKVKKTDTKQDDAVSPPDEIAQAIDAFREAQEQVKHFEGEMTIHKDKVLDYSHGLFSERALNGQGKSFKMLGDETLVTYVVMDSSAGLTEEDVAQISDEWGDEAADELVVRDFGSIKFNPKVLEANYDAVVEALQVLPESVLENLFKPMLMKARPGAVEAAKRFAKKPEDLKKLLKHLKMKNYLR